MVQAELPVAVRSMQISDLWAVMEIEQEAFSLPWPEHAYQHELLHNELAHYCVLCPEVPAADLESVSGWDRMLQKLGITSTPHSQQILGYGGFWMLADEAHISTLAVNKSMRRRQFGQVLLLAMLDEAYAIGASLVTLEVRASNHPAQSLYVKYGFEMVGRRKAYYHDNKEDALIMTTPPLDSVTLRELINSNRASLSQRSTLSLMQDLHPA